MERQGGASTASFPRATICLKRGGPEIKFAEHRMRFLKWG